MQSYQHFKLIDGRSGMPMGFTIRVKVGEDASAKLERAKEKAAIKKSCPIQMIEVVEYSPYRRKVKAT